MNMTESTFSELAANSVGGSGQDMAPAMALALSASFTSVYRWLDSLRQHAVGLAEADPDAWLLMSFSPARGRLVLHSSGEAEPGLPVLAVNARQAQTLALNSMDWGKIYTRYQEAVHACSDGLAADRARMGQALVLDVRRAGPFEQAKHMLPGAQWRDPAQVIDWLTELPTDREVIVYCIYGHEVGRATAMRLRASGVNACFLAGGIDAWEREGLPLQRKDALS